MTATVQLPEFDGCGMETPREDLDALRSLVLNEALDAPNVLRVVEVGSWAGRTALAMAQAAPAVVVHCVDTWLGNPNDHSGEQAARIGQRRLFQAFCRNTRPLLMDRIFPHVGTSGLWASVWPWQADLVFLDADHAYESVRRDIDLWTPLVRPGGVLCGHDHSPAFPGVQRAVAETGGAALCGRTLWYRRISPPPHPFPRSAS